MIANMPALDDLVARFRQGDRQALARLLSLAGRGAALPDLGTVRARGKVVAFTGSGGVGKSTLVGKMIAHLRGQGLKVAVLACDPQSPVSGGALLGDRFRMGDKADEGVFIRSLAALPGHGAIADHLAPMVRLLQAFGFDVVLIETAGSGQSDVGARDLADVLVLLLQPESGDELQWEKAGVLEVADVIVIHKADLPGAEQTAAQVRAILDLSGQRSIPLVKVSAKSGQGVEELWRAIEAVARAAAPEVRVADLAQAAQQLLADRVTSAWKTHDPALVQIVRRWQQGELSLRDAARAVLTLVTDTAESSQ